MTRILILLFLISTSVFSKSIPVLDAAKKGLIKVEVKGKGGYTGDVIEMNITNISGKDLELLLEPGLRLDSKDSTQQDILVNRTETFVLAKGKKKVLAVSGMCCQAHNHSPKKESKFSIGKMADSLLIKMANFINEKKFYSNSAAQHGVWVISDKNPVNSIFDGSDSTATRLVTEFVCKLLNKPLPDYKIAYAPDTLLAFSNNATKIEGAIQYYLANNSNVTIAVYDSKGNVVQAFKKESPMNPGTYNFHYTVNVTGFPHGKYYLRVRVDGGLKKEVLLEF